MVSHLRLISPGASYTLAVKSFPNWSTEITTTTTAAAITTTAASTTTGK